MKRDAEGWLKIDELIKNANAAGKSITLEQLHQVVATSEEQRFVLSDDGLSIRAI